MQIEIDSHSGFCYGVTKTIRLAEEALSNGQPVYCLGEIVHNQEEVNRLAKQGLVVIQNKDLADISGSKVLIRAHGEPDSTYQNIQTHGNQLFDGTCPIVLQLQKKVRKTFEEMKAAHGQVIIYGKKGHAEVVGLVAQTNNEAIVVSNAEELDKINFSIPTSVFAQTTQAPGDYERIITEIKARMGKCFPQGQIPLQITDSICRHVSKRGEHLNNFAQQHDVIIFVSGKNSSNGKVLYEVCRKANTNSYWIAEPGEIKGEWFLNTSSTGICGATSTPLWLMEKVAEKIGEITNN